MRDTIQATFFMEQHVGHRTYYENLRKYVDDDPRILANWVKVTYEDSNALWTKLPLLPANIKGTLIGRGQTCIGLRQTNPDVTFFFTQVPAALAGKLVRRTPYILTTDVTPIQYDDLAEHYGHKVDKLPILRAYKHYVNTQLFRKAARVLPWTNWVHQSFLHDYGVLPANMDIIPIGVDVNRWRPIETKDNKQVKILFVGGDLYRKGGNLLIEAFQHLPSGAAELILVTRTKISPQPGVTVLNNLEPNSPEIIALFQSCDVFVLPTRADSFGIVAVEASASGLPVLMTDVGGVRDIVIDGQTGFLLEPGNKDMLIQRLHLLVEDAAMRCRMGKAARQRAETHFDMKKNAKRIVDIIEQVVFEEKTKRQIH